MFMSWLLFQSVSFDEGFWTCLWLFLKNSWNTQETKVNLTECSTVAQSLQDHSGCVDTKQ
jgi:hypothetical protein